MSLARIIGFVALVALSIHSAQAQEPSTDYGTVASRVVHVSLVALLANGKKFDGKIVRVSGVMRLEFEGNGLYLSKDDHAFGISKNALWLSPDYKRLKANAAQLAKLNGRYVLLEGRYKFANNGHKEAFSGALESVNRILLLEK